MSKYLSKANEKINRENIEINNDGINVNNLNEMIYYLFAITLITFMLFLTEFLISKKIKTKKIINNIKLNINKIWRLFSFRLIKLLPINVKKVKKPNDSVKIKIIIINKFLFNKANII